MKLKILTLVCLLAISYSNAQCKSAYQAHEHLKEKMRPFLNKIPYWNYVEEVEKMVKTFKEGVNELGGKMTIGPRDIRTSIYLGQGKPKNQLFTLQGSLLTERVWISSPFYKKATQGAVRIKKTGGKAGCKGQICIMRNDQIISTKTFMVEKGTKKVNKLIRFKVKQGDIVFVKLGKSGGATHKMDYDIRITDMRDK